MSSPVRFRRRGRSVGRRGPRRKLVWARAADLNITCIPSTVPAPVDAQSVDLLRDFESNYGAQLIGATIMRVRGLISVVPSQNGGQSFYGAIGLKVDNQNIAIDSAAQRVASLSKYDRWFMYQPVVFQGGGSAIVAPQLPLQFMVDVRAKRKIDELDDTLWLCAESFGSENPGSTLPPQGFSFAYHLNVLIALS